MIVGIGVDIVDLARFERSATRTPALIPRLFADSERFDSGRTLTLTSFAGRFAAKEALIKALGDVVGARWHDMRVTADAHGNPAFEFSGAVADLVLARGITSVHLSMSHDAGVAVAFVVAERSVS